MYQKFVDGDDSYLTMKKEEDPFYDPPQDYLIGSANTFLQSLSYALDFDDRLPITDYKVGLSSPASATFFEPWHIYTILGHTYNITSSGL